MTMRTFTKPELLRYITALHEAAHAFVAHRSEHFKISDPAVTFPHSSTGHLARAHFGPKVKQPNMEKAHARDFIRIGYAGLHGQNLIAKHTLMSVLSSPVAGCEDDVSRVEEVAGALGIEDECDNLMKQSFDLVNGNSEIIHALADVIYNAGGNVSQPPGARGADGRWTDCREGAQGARPIRVWREVQLGDRAAVCEEVAAGECGAALAVPEGSLDRRHERGAVGAAGRGCQRAIGQRGEPIEGAVVRRACELESARSVGGALCVLVGGRHPHGSAQRGLGRAMPAGDHRCHARRQEGARGDR